MLRSLSLCSVVLSTRAVAVSPPSNGRMTWKNQPRRRALYLLQAEIDRARHEGRDGDAESAQALLNEAVMNVACWQVGTIDEITRFTRDDEIDFDQLRDYRTRIALEIMRLRGITPPAE